MFKPSWSRALSKEEGEAVRIVQTLLDCGILLPGDDVLSAERAQAERRDCMAYDFMLAVTRVSNDLPPVSVRQRAYQLVDAYLEGRTTDARFSFVEDPRQRAGG